MWKINKKSKVEITIKNYKESTRRLLDVIEEQFGYYSEEMNQALIAF
ncbi:MAG: hypothetical protein WC438_06110 [Candidatus Pacearchaeota archaeon]